jgi:hypothetical protein
VGEVKLFYGYWLSQGSVVMNGDINCEATKKASS